ncbi:acetyltransferase [Kocuria sp. CPCC 205292]|uniref:acetyltransferase n=1 Tax=Kocuria cellulosilytica TaxID=3071451 RepID=UPI0034D5D413
MTTGAERSPADSDIPVIDLSQAPGEGETWNRPKWMIYLWSATELVLVTNPWQISSGLRAKALRAFGAKIGDGVIIRPRTRIKFPWNLEIGDRSWIGEGVWIHNQNQVTVGHDSVISQETFITTGSHSHRKDMGLITRPISIGNGVWITARCVVTGGVSIGQSALVQPLTRVSEDIPENTVYGGANPIAKGRRFRQAPNERDKA